MDHIYCVPKYSVARMIGYLKGKISMVIFERFSKLKKNFKGHDFWTRGITWVQADYMKERSRDTSGTKMRMNQLKTDGTQI